MITIQFNLSALARLSAVVTIDLIMEELKMLVALWKKNFFLQKQRVVLQFSLLLGIILNFYPEVLFKALDLESLGFADL